MKKKNFLYFLLFLVSMTVVAGGYMLANKFMFYPIMAIYQIVSLITVCVYMYMYMSSETKLVKDKEKFGIEEAIERENKRKTVQKVFAAVFFPFVITVLCDYTYLLLLCDQEWFIALMKLFK